MNHFRLISLMIFALVFPTISQSRQPPAGLGENAALRYWSAFAEMRDSAITRQQATVLNQVVKGTTPYNDTEFKNLVERNRLALETMERGTELPECNWGIDYQLGPNAPVDYVRRALELGRLNVLYVYHLLTVGDEGKAVHSLAAGLRFSHDVANGGTLFAALAATSLLTAHLRAIEFALHRAKLSTAQRNLLSKALIQIGSNGVDWNSAVKQELAIFRVPFPTPQGMEKLSPQATAALDRIALAFSNALKDPSQGPRIQEMIVKSPEPLPHVIPNLSRVIADKEALSLQLRHVKELLR